MDAEPWKVYPDCPVITRPVEVGGQTKSQLLQRLRELSVRMNESANRLFSDDRFTTTATRHILSTVELTVGSLGYPQGAPWEEIRARSDQLGLDVCPLELGPHLRLAYLDQPEGSFGDPPREHRAPFGSVTVVSKPLDEDPDTPKGFYLRRIDGVLWLRGYRSERTYVWDPGDHLVFCRSTDSPTLPSGPEHGGTSAGFPSGVPMGRPVRPTGDRTRPAARPPSTTDL